MNVALQIATALAIVSEPLLPFTAKKLQKMLNLNSDFNWHTISASVQLPQGHQIQPASLLFEKIEDKAIEAQREKLNTKSQKKETELISSPPKDPISFDHFTALDLQVATIRTASLVPKTKKLLQITLEIGDKEATVVSGIAESYRPDEIIGKQVLYLANLAPRKIRGVESQGMLLLAEDLDGKLVFVSPETKINSGTKVS